jgi:hypothetical protein
MRPPVVGGCATTINLTLGLNKRNPSGLGFMSAPILQRRAKKNYIAVLDCVAPNRKGNTIKHEERTGLKPDRAESKIKQTPATLGAKAPIVGRPKGALIAYTYAPIREKYTSDGYGNSSNFKLFCLFDVFSVSFICSNCDNRQGYFNTKYKISKKRR